MSTVVLSVRVRRELKEEAERLGIDVRSVVEKALEEAIEKARLAKFRELVDKALSSIDLSAKEWIESIKETRYEE